MDIPKINPKRVKIFLLCILIGRDEIPIAWFEAEFQ
jgi:hypothetical protein